LESRLANFWLLHLDIINEKIWIQYDGTEDGIADELFAVA